MRRGWGRSRDRSFRCTLGNASGVRRPSRDSSKRRYSWDLVAALGRTARAPDQNPDRAATSLLARIAP